MGKPRAGIRPGAPLLEGSQAPDAVRAILVAKCGDCHSERTHYPLYAHLAPVSWMMERDILEARRNLDLSQWPSMNDESRMSVLTRMASVIRTGQMPPRSYVMLHPGARLSPDEQEELYAWTKGERKRIRQDVHLRSDQSSIESGQGK